MTCFVDTLFRPPSKITRLEISGGERISVLLDRTASEVDCDVSAAMALVECCIARFLMKRSQGKLSVTYCAADLANRWSAKFIITGKSGILELSFFVNNVLLSQRPFVTPITAVTELRKYTSAVCDQFVEHSTA